MSWLRCNQWETCRTTVFVMLHPSRDMRTPSFRVKWCFTIARIQSKSWWVHAIRIWRLMEGALLSRMISAIGTHSKTTVWRSRLSRLLDKKLLEESLVDLSAVAVASSSSLPSTRRWQEWVKEQATTLARMMPRRWLNYHQPKPLLFSQLHRWANHSNRCTVSSSQWCSNLAWCNNPWVWECSSRAWWCSNPWWWEACNSSKLWQPPPLLLPTSSRCKWAANPWWRQCSNNTELKI